MPQITPSILTLFLGIYLLAVIIRFSNNHRNKYLQLAIFATMLVSLLVSIKITIKQNQHMYLTNAHMNNILQVGDMVILTFSILILPLFWDCISQHGLTKINIFTKLLLISANATILLKANTIPIHLSYIIVMIIHTIKTINFRKQKKIQNNSNIIAQIILYIPQIFTLIALGYISYTVIKNSLQSTSLASLHIGIITFATNLIIYSCIIFKLLITTQTNTLNLLKKYFIITITAILNTLTLIKLSYINQYYLQNPSITLRFTIYSLLIIALIVSIYLSTKKTSITKIFLYLNTLYINHILLNNISSNFIIDKNLILSLIIYIINMISFCSIFPLLGIIKVNNIPTELSSLNQQPLTIIVALFVCIFSILESIILNICYKDFLLSNKYYIFITLLPNVILLYNYIIIISTVFKKKSTTIINYKYLEKPKISTRLTQAIIILCSVTIVTIMLKPQLILNLIPYLKSKM